MSLSFVELPSEITTKCKKRARNEIARPEREVRKMTCAMSKSDFDLILKSSTIFGNDTGISGNERDNVDQLSGIMYSIVQLTSDVPTFAGSDGQNYTVKTGDIAAIPSDQARVLHNRKMAVFPGQGNGIV